MIEIWKVVFSLTVITFVSALITWAGDRPQLLSLACGLTSFFIAILFSPDYRPTDRKMFIYPCDEPTNISKVDDFIRSIQEAGEDSTSLFDPYSAKCGDVIYVYNLIQRTEGGWFCTGDPKVVLSTKPIMEYEEQLTHK